MKKTANTKKAFTLFINNERKFAFHATDAQDAMRSATRWARYQGWSHEEIENFAIKESTPFEIKDWLHDEYID